MKTIIQSLVIFATFIFSFNNKVNPLLCQAFHISPLSRSITLNLHGRLSTPLSKHYPRTGDSRHRFYFSSNDGDHHYPTAAATTIASRRRMSQTRFKLGKTIRPTTGGFKMIMSTSGGETIAPRNVLTAIQQTITLLSKSSLGTSSSASASVALESITDALSTTPPLVYFLCLIAAGFGVPVSEDAMCIFAGTILPSIWTVDPTKRNRLLLALYGGVVISDIMTFCIGRALKMGVMEPIRKRMNLQTERIQFCKDATNNSGGDITNDDNINEKEIKDDNDDEEICQVETPKLRKRDRVLKKLENAGDYAGFVIRFSVGFRAPMMLFAGFSGKVPLSKYVIGTCIGAIGSLSLQLFIGYIMRYNPAAVVGIIASISTFVALVPLSIGLISSMSLMWQKYRIRRNVDGV